MKGMVIGGMYFLSVKHLSTVASEWFGALLKLLTAIFLPENLIVNYGGTAIFLTFLID